MNISCERASRRRSSRFSRGLLRALSASAQECATLTKGGVEQSHSSSPSLASCVSQARSTTSKSRAAQAADRAVSGASHRSGACGCRAGDSTRAHARPVAARMRMRMSLGAGGPSERYPLVVRADEGAAAAVRCCAFVSSWLAEAAKMASLLIRALALHIWSADDVCRGWRCVLEGQ